MQANIGQACPATRPIGTRGGRGVGRHAPDPEPVQQAFDLRREPGPVTRLAGDLTLRLLPQVLEETVRHPRLEAEAGRELHQ
jgi:hypothetical protein